MIYNVTNKIHLAAAYHIHIALPLALIFDARDRVKNGMANPNPHLSYASLTRPQPTEMYIVKWRDPLRYMQGR